MKTHKRKFVFAGLSVATLTAIVLGLKNKDSIIEIWSSFKNTIEKVPSKDSIKSGSVREEVQNTSITDAHPVRNVLLFRNEIDVCRHIRTLPKRFHHSVAKAAEAA